MKTILLLGATGFIGGHTLNALSQHKNIKLIAACRNQSKLNPDFKGEVREGDLRDSAYLQQLLEGADVVINAMSWTSLWGKSTESDELFLQPSLQLIKQYQQSKATRFVNLSTTSAAAPNNSADANSAGIPRAFWPHLCNVIKIENQLRKIAKPDKAVVNCRLGLFVGEHYGIGLLPILVPRLKTHLVPWVSGGKTAMPLTDGRDLGQAMALAALTDNTTQAFEAVNIVGSEIPTAREVITFLNKKYGLPKPHFGVPFWMAYQFAWLMEKLDKIVPWEPLIVRSIVHLLEETGANNDKAEALLGYQPRYHWQDTVRIQMQEMTERQTKPMSMYKSLD